MRSLKIGWATVSTRYRMRQFPQLRLKGFWLEALNWRIGDRVQVEAGPDVIVIRRLEKGVPQEL
jgi:hypothetical protein